ncbi:hypothetical protein [Pseudomonas sp.]|uniref:hypothetical protein n=1 Tax=Pseudomonas sp. TaxID=306 RepID=UPI002912DD82|nr:hypothetical protein [Pseudomonas sp.]MDU4254454.1 hypothetical protein [Pseudomonas sp.]
MTTTTLDHCASFEWRGPFLSLSRVNNDTLQVLRPETDWSDVVGDKPVIDNRNPNLADLYPKPRAMLDRMMNSLEGQAAATAPKVRGLGN